MSPGGAVATAMTAAFVVAACAPAAAPLAPEAAQTPVDDAPRAPLSRAAVDLACPVDRLRIERLPTRQRLYAVEGCGRRAVLLEQVRLSGPDAEGRVARLVRHANLSSPAAPGAPLDEEAARWRALVVQGARDLACAEDQVTPDIVWDRVDFHRPWAPRFPVVEGCGRRAVYDRHPAPALCDPTILSVEP